MKDQIKEIKYWLEGEEQHIILNYFGTLERISRTEKSGHLRSECILGKFSYPEMGYPFVMVADAFDTSLPKATSGRFVITSRIESIEVLEDPGRVQFTTTSGTIYELNNIHSLLS